MDEIQRRLAALLDDAAGQERTATMGFDRLATAVSAADDSDDRYRHVVMAFRYHHGGWDGGSNLNPMLTYEDGTSWPPLPPDVGADVVTTWREVLDVTESPVAVARLQHVLLLAGDGNRRERAAAATTALVEVSRRWEPVHALYLLPAALDLARRFGLTDEANAVIEQCFELIEKALQADGPKPGVPLRLLELIINDGVDDDRIDANLEAARRTFVAGHNYLSVLDLQRRRAAPTVRDVLDRDMVQALLDSADAADNGIARAHWLDQAITTAADRGVTDLRHEATRRRQEMTADDFELKKFTTEVELPEGYLDKVMDEYATAGSWPEALTRFAWLQIPSGDHERNVESVTKQAEMFPPLALLPAQLVDADGMSIYSADSDENDADVRLAQYAWMSTQEWSAIGDVVLRRLHEDLGAPDPDELIDWLAAHDHISEDVARSIVRSLRHWLAGEYEASSAIGIPKVEALVRALVLLDNAPIYRHQLKDRPGHYPGLRALLPVLEEASVEPSVVRYLESTFAHVAGGNLRNVHAHGHLTDPGPLTAAVVLHALFMLATLGDA